MAHDPGLAQRVREVLAGRAGVSERAMFGGLAFLMDGKTFVGIRNASLMARVGPERHRMPWPCRASASWTSLAGP